MSSRIHEYEPINLDRNPLLFNFPEKSAIVYCNRTVPVLSKDVKQRLREIGTFLASSDYDIVFLQEVWTRDYFKLIEKECRDRFIYSRCFFSGRLGTSGICILSRYRILDTFFHPFMLNGYWYQLLHGDSHVCKGAAFVRIMVENIIVNCFVTHLHAEYDRKNDVYFSHRVAQSYELLKLVDLVVPQHANIGKTVTIIAGDLNLEPQDLGLKLLLAGGFSDSWLERNGTEFGATCDRPDNCYTPSSSLKLWPQGKRIDYILYRTEGLRCTVTESQILCMKIPNSSKAFSDHEAVTATFKFVTDSSPTKVGDISARLRMCSGNADVLQMVSDTFVTSAKESAKSCWNVLLCWFCMVFMGILCILLCPALINAMTAAVYSVLVVAVLMHYLLVKRQEYIHLLEMSHQVDDDLKSRDFWKKAY